MPLAPFYIYIYNYKHKHMVIVAKLAQHHFCCILLVKAKFQMEVTTQWCRYLYTSSRYIIDYPLCLCNA